MARPTNSRSFQNENSLFTNMENILILEKTLEQNGQDWIENLNIIEQLLVRLVDRVSTINPSLKATFIIRRLPTYLAPYTNRNEYGVVLEDFEFTLSPPMKTKPRSSSTDKPGTANFGQLEIFKPQDATENAPKDEGEKSSEECELQKKASTSAEVSEDCEDKLDGILTENYAYCSHEIFKRFATAFVDAYQSECERNVDNQNKVHGMQNGCVQLILAHLLLDVKLNADVNKIFTLGQPPLPMTKDIISKCTVNVNYLKSLITLAYEESEVVVRPCLFHKKGYPRVNANISDRLPLHHSSFLSIGESLTKGFLLFPTSFDTLWTIQFWTAESHLISTYHPNSLISRIFKIYSSFCLNPIHFWETLNSSFLIGMDDMSSFTAEDCKTNLLTLDFCVSSFLHELEDFSGIEDWAARNFATRLMHLLRTSVDCYEKGFHNHYFTKINVLRGIWKNSSDHFEKEEKSVLRELDDITESQEDLEDYGEAKFMEIDDLVDDFGFQFDDLETIDDEDIKPRLTSETIYKSLNPFQSNENLAAGSQQKLTKESSRKPKTLSKMFGSNLARRISNKVTRRHSDAGKRSISLPSAALSGETMKSMTDIASGFEESIAQMRRQETLRQKQGFQDESFMTSETSFSQQLNHKSIPESTSQSQCQAGSSKTIRQNLPREYEYQNEGFHSDISESIYSVLLQTLSDLPPSDYLSDQELIAHLERSRRALECQEELVTSWCRAITELTKPKYICPHVFSPRQIQYLSLIIQTVSRCSPNMIQMVKTSKIPAWEISGDILRTVLHQMRAEVADNGTIREKQRPKIHKKYSFSSRNDDEKRNIPKKFMSMKFSLRKTSPSFLCKHIEAKGKSRRENESDGDTQLALEEPEIAATHRLLEWLWQLRCSEIGRLSAKANKYMEDLYKTSMINSHFLEQFSEDRMLKAMALRSAVAVTRIMADEKFPTHVPLYAATSKGWLWAEMILTLSSWNKEKGIAMKATIPLADPHPKTQQSYLVRVIDTSTMTDPYGSLKKKPQPQDAHEPDIDALTLALHSECAVPLGWNDFEDPRRPGPYTVPILIFSSMSYFKRWEIIPGNIAQVLVRLQKFNSLQHVGSMLSNPHRKTALNEVRKLNKSLSFRIYNFDDNVMSKTFRRLASLRHTRRKLIRVSTQAGKDVAPKYYSCRDVGCKSHSKETVTTFFNGMTYECTKL